MKLSEQWLREWVNPAVALSDLAEQLTMAGIEVEAIEPVAGEFSKVVIGEVIAAKPHENADKLRVCEVNVGAELPLQIVCGAANVRAGLKVPVALVGAAFANGFTIKEAKLRGVLSQGMICSASELGLAETSEGILALAADAPVGEDFREWLQLNDMTLEVAIPPNRGDCISVAGIAREIAVLNRIAVTPPIIQPAVVQAQDSRFPVTVSAQQDCPRYAGRVIKQIKQDVVTPLWMQERLRRGGLKCISPVVDVTNYVMLELGQPMHAFDLAKLSGQITVRRANSGEKLTLLDQQTVDLLPNTLLITDDNGPLAIAGVMGGFASAITATTTDIFLESAYFNPLSIAGQARQYRLQTDSAYRFERGVNPALQVQAIERATELLLAIVGGAAGPVIEVTAADFLPQPAVIVLRRKRIARLLGLQLADREIEDILTRLGMTLVPNAGGWQVTAPIHRFDIALEADLIEELVRVKGYDSVPLHYPFGQIQLKPDSERQISLQRVRAALVDRGYSEAITYSFVDARLQEALFPGTPGLPLLNPMSSEMAVMRVSLWPGLINALRYNQNRQQSRVRLFETGLCFIQQDGQIKQEMRLGGIAAGMVNPEQWGMKQAPLDFFDLKADVEACLKLAGIAQYCQFKLVPQPALHPGQSAVILYKDEVIGYLGKIHPALEQSLDLDGSVYLFELYLEHLQQASIPRYYMPSKFPAIRRDLAVVVPAGISAAMLQECIVTAAGVLLKQVQLFDVYQGAGIPAGCKSIAVALLLQHDERTLVEEEINKITNTITTALKSTFDAVLRD